jgi:hypothetical protein
MERIPRGWSRGLSLAVLLSLSLPVPAQRPSLSVYRCVDGAGRVSLQDLPCPPGQQDRHQQVQLDSEAPPAAPVLAPGPAVAPPPRAPPRPEPPPLWTCVDYQGERRLSSSDDPRPRYVPAWVLAGSSIALAGRRARIVPGAAPAGAPRTLVLIEDQCRRLSAQEACASYREQRDEARRGEHNNQGERRRALAAEVARLRAILGRYCGG